MGKRRNYIAGKILYAKDYNNSIETALSLCDNPFWDTVGRINDPTVPKYDITLSINFWLMESKRAMGFVRESTSEKQPEGIDVYKLPASLYLWAYTDRHMAQLVSKETCNVWALFAYIRNFLCRHTVLLWQKTAHKKWKCSTAMNIKQDMLICRLYGNRYRLAKR